MHNLFLSNGLLHIFHVTHGCIRELSLCQSQQIQVIIARMYLGFVKTHTFLCGIIFSSSVTYLSHDTGHNAPFCSAERDVVIIIAAEGILQKVFVHIRC